MGMRRGKRSPMVAGRKAEYLAALAPSATIARRLFQDAEVRVAARQVFDRAAELSRGVSGKKHRVGKLTRDEELQDGLAVLLRSMVHSIEGKGTSWGATAVPPPGRHRGRRTAVAAVAAGTAVAGVAWARRRRSPDHTHHDHLHDV